MPATTQMTIKIIFFLDTIYLRRSIIYVVILQPFSSVYNLHRKSIIFFVGGV
jgi:hypothetical protein